MVLIALMAGSYPLAEVLSRPSLPAARFAITLLSAGQRVLTAQLRDLPDAALGPADPRRRGARARYGLGSAHSGSRAGGTGMLGRPPRPGRHDHLLVISTAVTRVAYAAESGDPLVRFRGRYTELSPLSRHSRPAL